MVLDCLIDVIEPNSMMIQWRYDNNKVSYFMSVRESIRVKVN